MQSKGLTPGFIRTPGNARYLHSFLRAIFFYLTRILSLVNVHCSNSRPRALFHHVPAITIATLSIVLVKKRDDGKLMLCCHDFGLIVMTLFVMKRILQCSPIHLTFFLRLIKFSKAFPTFQYSGYGNVGNALENFGTL